MSYVKLSWQPPEQVPDGDVVGAAVAAGLPVHGRGGRIFILHHDGVVTAHVQTHEASAVLAATAGNELLLWLLREAAVAATLRRLEKRVECVLSLEDSPPADQAEAARAIELLLDGLQDVAVDASLTLPEEN
jgi:hypothetical protein